MSDFGSLKTEKQKKNKICQHSCVTRKTAPCISSQRNDNNQKRKQI